VVPVTFPKTESFLSSFVSAGIVDLAHQNRTRKGGTTSIQTRKITFKAQFVNGPIQNNPGQSPVLPNLPLPLVYLFFLQPPGQFFPKLHGCTPCCLKLIKRKVHLKNRSEEQLSGKQQIKR
jgi:hypothetical protein